MSSVKLEHALSFIRVIEAGSFTQAAEEAGVSKGVLSQHVNTLEQQLGVQLLTRTTRRLHLTDLGTKYYELIRDIPRQFAGAQELLLSQRAEPYGTLRLVVPQNFTASLKESVLPNYLKQYSKVKVALTCVPASDSDLMSDYDIRIAWKLANERFPDYNLVAKKILTMNVGMYASANYIRKHGTPKTIEELKHHNCFSSAGNVWPYKSKGSHVKMVEVQGQLQTSDESVVHSAVLNDIGIAYSYPFVFEKELRDGTIKAILPELTQLSLEIYAFYKPTEFLPKKTQAFIDILLAYYKERQTEISSRGRK